MAPGKFSSPPITPDPATGQPAMTGADGVPWSIDTLALGGDIRAKYIRLQNWVRGLFGDAAPDSAKP